MSPQIIFFFSRLLDGGCSSNSEPCYWLNLGMSTINTYGGDGAIKAVIEILVAAAIIGAFLGRRNG